MSEQKPEGGGPCGGASPSPHSAGPSSVPSPRGAVGSSSPSSQVLARTPSPGAEGLSRVLAIAFLDTDTWEHADLVAAGAVVLGARRRWLGPLVRSVLAGYPRRPAGGRRELARWILAHHVFREAESRAARRGAPLAPARYLTSEEEDVTPEVWDLTWLARELRLTSGELDWFADTRHWNRRTSNPALRHYRHVWRRRPGRVPRLLEVPGIRLRTAQRRVLDRILAPLPLHPAAHGFVHGRSAVTGARLHTGAEVVISADLTAFFAHVTPGRVFGLLRRAGFPEATAHAITGICTHSVPEAVLRGMPDGGSPAERFALAQALRAAHLPQGAPSSPALANLAVRRLDARLTGFAESCGGRYTRYADDLVLSGPAEVARRADAVLRGMERIVSDEGFVLNATKTRVRGSAVRQTVTGVVVNARTNVARPEYDTLKATLHNCLRDGVESQRHGHPAFREHLAGRISWVSALNPARGQKLRDTFDRIEWG